MLAFAALSDRNPYYSEVDDGDWNDWRWQQRRRVTTLEELERVIRVTDEEREAYRACVETFRMAITPYYLSLMSPDDPACPIRRQAVPSLGELTVLNGELADPLSEEAHMPAPGLTHRYPDRALLYTTHHCAMYCRFCTRKRKVSDPSSQLARPLLEDALEHIRRTPAIKDVIVSGGDPLSLSTERLGQILTALDAIPHVEVARIGTRNLVTLPQRVDEELAQMLRDHQTRRLAVFVMTHFNHPAECTDAAWVACERIARSGTPIQNQMVLLRGVNDEPSTVIDLNRRLLRMRVKPYYMLQADMAEGIGHFRTSVKRGVEILESLRGHVSGLAVPQYVVDLPGGGGKVSLVPDYVISSVPGEWVFRNYQGRAIPYPETEL